MGNVVVLDGKQRLVPASGQITLDSKPQQSSPIGDDGDFYFEDVRVGTTKATVEYKNGTCSFDMIVPEFKEPLRRLGTIECSQH
jgi:hypothetical protein